ncbi:MAG: hypothetical protein CL819_09870 [Croceicoccus sp.]|jgi:hypothetical protein|nr:hypothetical protein [Croceicoccus sp.]
MRSLAPDLWVTEQPLRFAGLDIGSRMSVVRLGDGGLFVHSPIEAAPERVAEVRALGAVRAVVAPNRFHHLFAGAWKQAFPEAGLYGAPGLDAKRDDLAFDAVLSDRPEPAWSDDLDQLAVQGFPLSNEVVFFHRGSGTLITTDLAFNTGSHFSGWTRFSLRLAGVSGFGPTLLERLAIRDRAAFRRSLEQILAWPFDRVIVGHGDVLEKGGRDALARGYAFLLR